MLLITHLITLQLPLKNLITLCFHLFKNHSLDDLFRIYRHYERIFDYYMTYPLKIDLKK